MDCACQRFPLSATLGKEKNFSPEVDEPGYAFVQAHIENSLVLIGKDHWYSQAWSSAPPGSIVVTRLLDEGAYYCCRTCGSSFLIVLDTSNEDFMVLAIDVKELGESTPFQLRERFSAAFKVEPQGPSPAKEAP